MLCELRSGRLRNRGRVPFVQDVVVVSRLVQIFAVAVVLGACGSEQVDVTDETDGTGGGGGTGAIEYPTAADQAVVRLTMAGGFVPEGSDFRSTPALVIEGDGSVFRPGAQIEIFPPPLLPAVTVAPLDEEGIQIVLDAAQQAGLLAPPPSYEPGADAAQVADVPTTVLELQANGETYRHEAYALGFQPTGEESTTERATLNEFVNQLLDLPTLVGDHLGTDELYEPERFGVMARPATPEELTPTEDGIEPDVVPWPADAPPLASMATCTEVPADTVAAAFAEANQLTRFSQDGVTYTAFVRVLLPDETCPPA